MTARAITTTIPTNNPNLASFVMVSPDKAWPRLPVFSGATIIPLTAGVICRSDN
jgi:hypothetical protein